MVTAGQEDSGTWITPWAHLDGGEPRRQAHDEPLGKKGRPSPQGDLLSGRSGLKGAPGVKPKGQARGAARVGHRGDGQSAW